MFTRRLPFERFSHWPGAFCEGFLELIFPPACTACGARMSERGPASFCEPCLQSLETFAPPFCPGCGASVPVELAAGSTCGHCRGEARRFDHAVALGPYDGLLRDLLLRSKKPAGELVAVALARQLLARQEELLRDNPPDVVCPVPMHWRRRTRRLCNSPTTMADVLAVGLAVPFAANLLCRVRRTAPQVTLPPSGRAENVRRAFSLRSGYQLDSAHVLLVDDILTTGATCNEAARVLKRGGASRVTVAVIGRSFSGR